MFTDIRHKDWIKALPGPVQPYLYLMRADRPIGSWLLFWPGAWGIVLAAQYPDQLPLVLYTLLLFAIGAPIMRGAGCTINDLWDRNLDRHVERTATRPIASGQIPVRYAMVFLAGLLLIGLYILTRLSPTAVLLGLACIPLIVLYPLMKRYTFWPQAFLGLTFNFGALIGWAAIDVTVSQIAVALYLGGVFWTIGYDTIYAFQDIEDDLTIGIKSTALLFQDRPLPMLSFFYMAAMTLIGYALILAAGTFLAIVFLLPAIWYSARLLYVWNPDSQENSLAVFKNNKILGGLIFLACLLTGVIF